MLRLKSVALPTDNYLTIYFPLYLKLKIYQTSNLKEYRRLKTSKQPTKRHLYKLDVKEFWWTEQLLSFFTKKIPEVHHDVLKFYNNFLLNQNP